MALIGGRLWARVLVVVVLAVCVAAMHSTPVIGPTGCQHAAPASDAAIVGVHGHGDGPSERGPCSPIDHHILTVCLAILVAAILLCVSGAIRRHGAWFVRVKRPSGPVRAEHARAPPATARRLAQLCVLRC